MNYEKLRKDVGRIVRLHPPVLYLDELDEVLPIRDDHWRVVEVERSGIVLQSENDFRYTLGLDHIKCFHSDGYDKDGKEQGLLLLLIQILVKGTEASFTPSPVPGKSVLPSTDVSLIARSVFVPELIRITKRQIYILDRVVANYIQRARRLAGLPCQARSPDTWNSLRPEEAVLFPHSIAYRDLRSSDAEILSEFISSIIVVEKMVTAWHASADIDDYNAWNGLMHNVEISLRIARKAVLKFCPDRIFGEESPASGTILKQIERVLGAARTARDRMIQDSEAARNKKA